MIKKIILGISAFVLPILAFAQGGPTLGNVQTFMTSIDRLISLALPMVVALALLFFFWGLAKFILSADDEGARDGAKNIMIWGIVALFVMVSVWGLVQFVGQALGIQQGQSLPNVPTVNR